MKILPNMDKVLITKIGVSLSDYKVSCGNTVRYTTRMYSRNMKPLRNWLIQEKDGGKSSDVLGSLKEVKELVFGLYQEQQLRY